MAAAKNELELELEFLPYNKAYKNGVVERLKGTESIPAGTDPVTGVSSKDVTGIIPETEVYVRIYHPKITNNQKLPLLVYYHGGAFLVHTPSTPLYHNYLNAALVAKSRVIAVSVHYRRAPEHCLPVTYEDSWAALHWISSHANGDGLMGLRPCSIDMLTFDVFFWPEIVQVRT